MLKVLCYWNCFIHYYFFILCLPLGVRLIDYYKQLYQAHNCTEGNLQKILCLMPVPVWTDVWTSSKTDSKSILLLSLMLFFFLLRMVLNKQLNFMVNMTHSIVDLTDPALQKHLWFQLAVNIHFWWAVDLCSPFYFAGKGNYPSEDTCSVLSKKFHRLQIQNVLFSVK